MGCPAALGPLTWVNLSLFLGSRFRCTSDMSLSREVARWACFSFCRQERHRLDQFKYSLQWHHALLELYLSRTSVCQDASVKLLIMHPTTE